MLERRRVLLLLVLTLWGFVASGTGRAAEPPSSSPEEEILALEKQLATAFLKRDAGLLEAILADDWVEIDVPGRRLGKTEFMKRFRSSDIQIDSATVEDIEVRVFGDTAIATGVQREKSSDKGMDTSGTYWFTDVFLKRKGRWWAVATHVSTPPCAK